MSNYLSNFLTYTDGTECPETFWRWSAISLLSHIAGRKIWFYHGDFKIHCNMYITLVGGPGSGKSTAKDEVRDLLLEEFPTYMEATDIQSREDIIKRMAKEECLVAFKNLAGKMVEYRPFYILADEFSNFLSVNPEGMIGFLTGVYGANSYSTGFKNTESQRFDNPYVSMLACGVPDWFVKELRTPMVTGGLGRRLILVVAENNKIISRPYHPKGWQALRQKVIEHLSVTREAVGEFKMTPIAVTWWDDWYDRSKKNPPADPVLLQFHARKEIILLKVAMVLGLTEAPVTYKLTDDLLAAAGAMIDLLEPNVEKLSRGVGRNELAAIAANVLATVEHYEGVVSERQLYKVFNREARIPEWEEILQSLQNTGQTEMIESTDEAGVTRRFVILPASERGKLIIEKANAS